MSIPIDEAKALAEMSAVADEPMTLEIRGGELITLIAAVQLACRHPNFSGPSRQVVERIGRNWQDIVADPASQMWRALEAGWNPEHDTPRPAPPVPKVIGVELANAKLVELGRGNAGVIRTLTRALIDTLNAWIGEHAPVDYVDVFMSAHNFHCATLFDLEKQTGTRTGELRRAVLDTLAERFRREGYQHVSNQQG